MMDISTLSDFELLRLARRYYEQTPEQAEEIKGEIEERQLDWSNQEWGQTRCLFCDQFVKEETAREYSGLCKRCANCEEVAAVRREYFKKAKASPQTPKEEIGALSKVETAYTKKTQVRAWGRWLLISFFLLGAPLAYIPVAIVLGINPTPFPGRPGTSSLLVIFIAIGGLSFVLLALLWILKKV